MQKFLKIKHFRGFNWYGFYTLYLKEVKRFFSVFAQTILAPAITTLLFYMIFTISIDREYLNTEKYSLRKRLQELLNTTLLTILRVFLLK